MTTPTTTPVPSTNPQDLLFNAEKLDEMVNGPGLTYVDRFGVTRKSLGGMIIALAASVAAVEAGVPAAASAIGADVADIEARRSAAAAAIAAMLAGLTGDELANLQSAIGAAMIGRPNGRSVANRLDEQLTLLDKGATVGTTVSSQAALTALLASAAQPLISPGDYLTPDLQYPAGRDLSRGGGRLFKSITGGKQQLNSYADSWQYVEGLEYALPYQDLVLTQLTGATRPVRAGFGGDSRFEGFGVSPDYVPSTLFVLLANADSVQTPAGIISINIGHSGWSAAQWAASSGPVGSGTGSGAGYGLQKALASELDLLFLSLMTNEPGYLKDGTAAPINAGQDYPNRRDIADGETALRTSLTALRAAKTFAQQTIVLEIPYAAADTPNGRDERWYEQVAPLYRRLAREFKCVLIDFYAYFRDARYAAVAGTMDSPAIHARNAMNLIMASIRHDVIYPRGLKLKAGKGNLQVVCASEDLGDGNRNLTAYHDGLTVGAARNNFPSVGTYALIAAGDGGADGKGSAMQWFWPSAESERTYAAFRLLNKTSVGPWQTVGAVSTNVTAPAGFSSGAPGAVGAPGTGAGAMRIMRNGESFFTEGYITLNAPSLASVGTVFGVIPAGARPLRSAIKGVDITVETTTVDEYLRGDIGTDGTITLKQNSVGTVLRFYVNAIWSRLA